MIGLFDANGNAVPVSAPASLRMGFNPSKQFSRGEGDRDIFDAEFYRRDVELLDPHWGIDEMETGRFQAGAQSLDDQKWSEAVRAINDSLEETGGGHQHARFGLALALWRLGRAKDAKRLIEICLENRADWPRAKLALAAVSTEA